MDTIHHMQMLYTMKIEEILKEKMQRIILDLDYKDHHHLERKLGAGIKLPMPNNMMDGNPRMWDDGDMNAGSGQHFNKHLQTH